MAEQYLSPLHMSISVKDVDASIAWYKEHLDFDLVFKMYLKAHNAHLAFIRHGKFEIEMFQHDESGPIPKQRLDPHEDQKTRGAKHVAFLVENADALHDRLKSKGVEISISPRVMENKDLNVREKIFFIHDLDGINIEFIERL